jgi:hypothetical protein
MRVLRYKILSALVLVLLAWAFAAPAFCQDKGEAVAVAPQRIDFGVIMGGRTAKPVKLCITSKGLLGSAWRATASKPWIVLDRTFGYIGETAPCIEVHAGSYGLSLGRNIARIILSCENETVSVPVEITIMDKAETAETAQRWVRLDLKPSYVDPLFSGRKRSMRAFGTASNGSSSEVTDQVKWVSEDETIAAFTGQGLL